MAGFSSKPAAPITGINVTPLVDITLVLLIIFMVTAGAGFGREARRCAMRKRWSPGLDRAGNPTNAVALVNVRFDR